MDSEKLLSRGVEEVIIKEHLEERLQKGDKLRVKFGIDPTAPDLHLGHTVPLRKLRQFQDAGHKAVLIIGDFTAQIGDPSGRSEERKPLTEKDVRQNLKKYLKQAGKVLNLWKAEVRYNSKWLKKNTERILEVARAGTVNQVIQRAEFKKRIDEGGNVTVLESLYPLLQGYDSVEVKADLEIGGTDQKFNLLMGRQLQRHFGMPEQDVMTLPLLEGTDGVKKMSKSAGNYIALDAEPDDMFGKIMRIPDNLIDKYYTLLTDENPPAGGQEPREAKLELANIIVGMYHGSKAGEKAKTEFIKVHTLHQKPSNIPVRKDVVGMKLYEGLKVSGMTSSASAARELIEQGGVYINEERTTDPYLPIPPNSSIRVGPNRFLDT